MLLEAQTKPRLLQQPAATADCPVKWLIAQGTVLVLMF